MNPIPWAAWAVWTTPPRWGEAVPCWGKTALMFGDDEDAARRVCEGCPFVVACLSWALDAEESWGVWGGRTWEERLRVCPICQREKQPEDLGCSGAHSLLRWFRLQEMGCAGNPDCAVNGGEEPSARTFQGCTRPRGLSHNTAAAVRKGCKCRPALDDLALERLETGKTASRRGPYGTRLEREERQEGRQ